MFVLSNFSVSAIQNFFIAFGVVVGASLFAGLGAVITGQPPLRTMTQLADSMKIWGMAVALGGTFSSFAAINKGLFQGEIKTIIKQVIYIFVALLGSNAASTFIQLIQRCGQIWSK